VSAVSMKLFKILSQLLL